MEYSKQDLLDTLENTKTMRDSLVTRKNNLLQSIEQMSSRIEFLEQKLKEMSEE